MPLNNTERNAFIALQHKRHAIEQEQQQIVNEIESRLGLSAGEIGSKYVIHLERMQVVPVPVQQDAKREPADAAGAQ
jgi:hypothetical protein